MQKYNIFFARPLTDWTVYKRVLRLVCSDFSTGSNCWCQKLLCVRETVRVANFLQLDAASYSAWRNNNKQEVEPSRKHLNCSY